MKKYIKPMMESETFVSNEYVGVCWGIKCDLPSGSGWDSQGGYHSANDCGNSENQLVTEVSPGVYSFIEVKNSSNLEADIYLDGFGEGKTPQSTINQSDLIAMKGKKVYWTTKYWSLIPLGYTTYYHEGYIEFTGKTTNHS